MRERDKLAAEIYASLQDALPKRRPPLEAKPEAPPARVAEREVRVATWDPNYSPENRGRVRVAIYEELYRQAVDRAFSRPVFAEVVSGYDPFAKQRMPGFDGEE
jgi:hypothetical protein